jgi:hypothetical protein
VAVTKTENQGTLSALLTDDVKLENLRPKWISISFYPVGLAASFSPNKLAFANSLVEKLISGQPHPFQGIIAS